MYVLMNVSLNLSKMCIVCNYLILISSLFRYTVIAFVWCPSLAEVTTILLQCANARYICVTTRNARQHFKLELLSHWERNRFATFFSYCPAIRLVSFEVKLSVTFHAVQWNWQWSDGMGVMRLSWIFCVLLNVLSQFNA